MDSTNSVFKNRFLLNFKDNFIQAGYDKIRQNRLLKGNLVFLSITLLISILETVFLTKSKEIYLIVNILWYYINLYTSISIFAIILLDLILIPFVKSYKFQKISTLLSYILLTISLLMFRQIFSVIFIYNQTELIIVTTILLMVEFIVRFLLFSFYMITFVEGFVANIICIILFTACSKLVYGDSINDRDFYGYIVMMAIIILLTYFSNLDMRKTFYVKYQLEKKNKWHTSIMNNMNSGFICIKEKKIDFVNFPMLEKMKSNREISKILGKCEILNDISRDHKEDNILLNILGNKIEKTNEEMLSIIRDDEEVCTKILDVILQDVKCDFNDDIIPQNNHKASENMLLPEITKPIKAGILNGKLSSSDFLKKFQSDYLTKKLDENFTFVGYKDLEVQRQCNGVTITELINMEITGRFYQSNEYNQSETFEFMFKDITRTKQIEEKNAEFKYKTLFLSKVAHEFKNPIICIIELVNQINDDLQQNDEKEINTDLLNKNSSKKKSIDKALKKSLPLIKALSNYLLILVKDLDFFSQNQIGGSNQKLDMNEADLNEILEFCSEISHGLLNKNNKQSNVTFLLDKGVNLPEKILTDDTKLKQILINLISNAIKFTEHGNLTLGVKIQSEGMLRFQVEDTGLDH